MAGEFWTNDPVVTDTAAAAPAAPDEWWKKDPAITPEPAAAAEPPPVEEIKAAPTVFGELGKGNFINAARLAKDALGNLVSPTQPTSALQVAGAGERSLLGTTQMLEPKPDDAALMRMGKATVNAGNRFMAGLTTPEMLPLLVVGGGGGGLGRAAAGAFAAQTIAGIPDIAARIKASEDTKAWSQERWEAALDTALNAAFLKGMVTHAIHGAPLPEGQAITAPRMLAPEVPLPITTSKGGEIIDASGNTAATAEAQQQRIAAEQAAQIAATGAGPAPPQVPETIQGGGGTGGGGPGAGAQGARRISEAGGTPIRTGPEEGARILTGETGEGIGGTPQPDRRGTDSGALGDNAPGIPESGGLPAEVVTPPAEPVTGAVQPPPVTLTGPITEANMADAARQLGLVKPAVYPEVGVISAADPAHGGNISIPIGATMEEAARLKHLTAAAFAAKTIQTARVAESLRDENFAKIKERIAAGKAPVAAQAAGEVQAPPAVARLYRGSKTPEAQPQLRDFGAVFSATDRATAEQYGQHVAEYDFKGKLLDSDSDTARHLAEQYSGKDYSDPNEWEDAFTQYYAFPDKQFAKFLSDKGYDGFQTGKDIGVFDPNKLQAARPALPPPKTTAAAVARVKAGKARGFTLPHQPLGVPDIIDVISENGGIKSKPKTGDTASWDSQPDLRGVYRQLLGGTRAPDDMAGIAAAEGFGDGTVAGFWDAVDKAVKGRRSMREQVKAQGAQVQLEKAQGKAFAKEVQRPAKGSKFLNTANLQVGDVVTVNKEQLKVTEIDPDTLDVTLEDGKKYGVQHVANNQAIYVDKADLVPREQDQPPAGPKPAEAPLPTSDVPLATETLNNGQKYSYFIQPTAEGGHAVYMRAEPGGRLQAVTGSLGTYDEALQLLKEQLTPGPGRGTSEFAAAKPAAPPPTLRPGEKAGELFQGADQPFNLAGETTVDTGAQAQAAADAAAAAEQARIEQEKQQQPLFPAAMGAASIHEPLARYEMRGFAEKVQADQTLAQAARDAIGNRYYEPIPNVRTAAEAEALVQQRGPIESIKIITDLNNGLEPRHRITMGINVMRKLNQAYENLKGKDPAAADKILDAQADLTERVQEIGTLTAQGLQSFKMFEAMGVDGKLRMVQNQIKRVRDKFTSEHQGEVTEIVDQINQGGDVEKQKQDLIDKEANRIARILSDTPAFDKLKKGEKGNEALALIRAHLKEPQADFVEKLIDLGAEPQLAGQIDRMAIENRRRIEVASRVRGIQAREKSLDNVANRIARHLSDTPDFRGGNAGNLDPARELIRQHLKEPQPGFVDNLIRLGAKRSTAETIDRLAIENRKRILVVDRAQRVRALEKLYSRTGNKVARAIPKPLWNKIVDLADAGLLTKDSFYDLAAKRLGLPALDQAGRVEMARLAHEVQAAPEGIPRDRATLKLHTFLAHKLGFAPKDMALGIYYGNMLSHYNTHIVNALDTFINVGSEITGMAASNPQAAARIFAGAFRGFINGHADAILAFTRGRMITDGKYLEAPRLAEIARFGEKGGVPISEKTLAGRIAKRIGESKIAYPLRLSKFISSRLLSASDAIMFRTAEEARLSLLSDRVAREEGLTGQAKVDRVNKLLGLSGEQMKTFQEQAAKEGFTGGHWRRLIQRASFKARVQELRRQSIRADARADATDFAGIATYNHPPQGVLGYFAGGMRKAAEKVPLLKIFVPFTDIVANVTNRGLNYTPWGYKRAIKGYSFGEVPTGDAKAAMLARATLGTVGLSTLAAMQGSGLIKIHGNGPTDPEKRRQLINAGWKPYSLELPGGNYFTYTYTPVGLGLSVIGNLTDTFRYNEMTNRSATMRGVYAMSRIGSTVFSQSFLSGLNNLFQALSGQSGDVVSAVRQTFASTAGTFTTPGIVNDLYHFWDPTRYSSETLAGDLLRNTPFAALTNQPILNAFGEPVRTPSNRFYSHLSDDPAWAKVVKYNLRVPVPDKQTQMPMPDGTMRPMTAEEYYQYLKLTGPVVKDILKALEFDNVPLDLGQKMLDEAAQTVRGEVLTQLRDEALLESIK